MLNQGFGVFRQTQAAVAAVAVGKNVKMAVADTFVLNDGLPDDFIINSFE